LECVFVARLCGWYNATPEGFLFSVKGGRFITHFKRLKDVETPLANFFASGVLRLREKRGPILWQLPPRFVCDPVKRSFGCSHARRPPPLC
jgi:uncharacterized protein YecE (DUF72 family)